MLEASGLNYTYPSTGIKAVRAAGLKIEKGKLCAVLGRSGCGKSTLISLLAGILTPDSGTVTLDGKPLLPKNHNIALIPQEGALLPWLTVEQNALLGYRIKTGRKQSPLLEPVLERMGLSPLRKRRPNGLSGGQRQRVSLSRALIQEAQLLLMDEPFSALDADTREDAQDFMRELAPPGAALMVTHSVEEAAVLGDTVIVMAEGEIRSVFENPLKNEKAPRESSSFYQICNELRAIMREQ